MSKIYGGSAKPASGGGSGSAVIEALSITPLTETQTITVQSGTDGFNPVNVSAVTNAIDANITAGNIKKDVTILGVTGSYEGTTINNQNKTLTANGTYTADSGYTGLGTVTVNVAGGGNGLEIPKEVTNYGGVNTLRTASYPSGGYNIPSNCTQIAARALTYAFCEISMSNGSFSAPNVTNIEQYGMDYFNYNSNRLGVKSVNLSNLVQVGNCGLQNAFYGSQCTEIRLPNLTTVDSQGLSSAFAQSRDVASINLSSLENIVNNSACSSAFYRNDALVTLSFPLKKVTASSGCSGMFNGCPLLSNFDVLSTLEEVSGQTGCQNMFAIDSYYQANLDVATSATFSVLAELSGRQALKGMFSYRKALSSVSFPALKSDSFGSNTNQFNTMLQGCENVTVHFPSNLQSVIGAWADVMAGFGGTNTTVLFDLTATS